MSDEIRYKPRLGRRCAAQGATNSVGAMKAVAIIAVVLLLAVNAVALLPADSVVGLVPAAGVALPYGPHATLVLGVVALIAVLAVRGAGRPAAAPVAAAARPIAVPVAAPANRAEAEIVAFLSTLQAKGRLVDFLMEDINGADDAQVGAAARVVHAGCKAVLAEHFRIRPLRAEAEGTRVQIAAGTPADEYRLLGKISGQPPFSGVLVHPGWQTESVKLPTLLRGSGDRLPAIAPAEVELT